MKKAIYESRSDAAINEKETGSIRTYNMQNGGEKKNKV